MRRNPVLFILLSFALLAGCDSDSAPKGDVIITDIEIGSGTPVRTGNTLIVEYVGRFSDGSIFDSTDEKGEPFVFTLGVNQVIKGWDSGLQDMKVGGKRRLEIPSHLAFGKKGQCFSTGECAVPGNTDVIYEVELIDIFDEVITQDIVTGDGLTAELGDVLVVSYIGQLSNREGSVFDASTIQAGNFLFTLGAGSVISGWDIGLQGMKVGGKRELTIPPMFGYGAFGRGPIPSFAVLFFTVDLIEVVKRPTG
ncbi:MAG: FKBP-type peptidyl-prolyl cis-trans isomerase [Bacteroidetes bacterium]|nr:FKBP-type peptidyl-prolyl cis-trans isomerase [Bacteroidota bacterium]